MVISRAIVNGDHNNFGPRAGFAWQASKKLVLRGGYGLFYGERDQNQQVTQFSGNYPNVYSVAYPTITATNTVNPPYTINTPVPIVATNASLAGFTPALPYVGTLRSQGFNQAADPMVHQYNFNIEYQLTGSWLLATSYSGLQGRDLSSMFINENQLPFSAALSGKNTQANRPFPIINGTVIPTFSTGTNNYNSFNARIDKRFSKGLTLLANYTIQKNIEFRGSGPDSYTQNGTSIAMDTYNLSREKSVAPIDVPQIFSTSAGYALPFGLGRPWLSHGLAGKLIGGWDVERHRDTAGRLSHEHSDERDSSHFQYLQRTGRGGGPAPGGEQSRRRRLFQSRRLDRAGHHPERDRRSHSTIRNGRAAGGARARLEECGRVPLQELPLHRTSLSAISSRVLQRYQHTDILPARRQRPRLTCEGPAGTACNAGNPSFGKLSDGTATGRQIQFGLKYYF